LIDNPSKDMGCQDVDDSVYGDKTFEITGLVWYLDIAIYHPDIVEGLAGLAGILADHLEVDGASRESLGPRERFGYLDLVGQGSP
jgi:hypothetical protein